MARMSTAPPAGAAAAGTGAPTGAGGEYADPREAILRAALAHVKTEGWSKEALAAGAADVGLPAVAQGMFEGGAVELAHYVMRRGNEAMASHLASLDLATMSVNARIKEGVKARLEFLAPYLPFWPQAMALGALPSALPTTLHLLGIMADEVWWHAGDRSTDLNWYSRRLLLMGVYGATEAFMLTDSSPGFEDTWRFLDHRLAEVALFGRQAGEALGVARAVGSGMLSIAGAGIDLARPALTAVAHGVSSVAGSATSAARAAARAVPGARAAAGEGGSASSGATPPGPGAAGAFGAAGSSRPAGLPGDAVLGVVASAVAPVAATVVGTAGNVLNGIASAAASRGIRLPEPPPMLSALLAVVESAGRPAPPPPPAPAPRVVADPATAAVSHAANAVSSAAAAVAAGVAAVQSIVPPPPSPLDLRVAAGLVPPPR